MNRRERRKKRAVRIGKSETTEHATVMVMNNPKWTPFIEATWLAHHSRVGEKIFLNSRYQVAVYPPAPAKASAEGWPCVVHLCFKHVHNIAITDFRDFQRIKNELVDPAAFTFQIYPDEAHLVDTQRKRFLRKIGLRCPMAFSTGVWSQISLLKVGVSGHSRHHPTPLKKIVSERKTYLLELRNE